MPGFFRFKRISGKIKMKFTVNRSEWLIGEGSRFFGERAFVPSF